MTPDPHIIDVGDGHTVRVDSVPSRMLLKAELDEDLRLSKQSEENDVLSMAASLLAADRGITFREASIHMDESHSTKIRFCRLAQQAIDHIPYLKGRYK